MGVEPLEKGDHLDLGSCVDSAFKVGSKDKREWMYASLATFCWPSSPWSCAGSQMEESFIHCNLPDHWTLSFGEGSEQLVS